jgi:hypothetical protein
MALILSAHSALVDSFPLSVATQNAHLVLQTRQQRLQAQQMKHSAYASQDMAFSNQRQALRAHHAPEDPSLQGSEMNSALPAAGAQCRTQPQQQNILVAASATHISVCSRSIKENLFVCFFY